MGVPNARKAAVLDELRNRFGAISKIGNGTSLFSIAGDTARVYFRFSKLHGRGAGFFGLREIDLRVLEGHNSYICFLTDDNAPPVFLPFADFEEIFCQATPATDGQYKVQLISRGGQLDLYVARQGRFNVEGYVGFEVLERSVQAGTSKADGALSHWDIQTLLAGIGHLKGFDVCVPSADRARFRWALTKPFKLMDGIPSGFESVRPILSEIDVIWVAEGRNRVEALFEVEHTTTIYSGLLRLNDILLTEPGVSRFCIVADECRRSVFARQVFRPTFRKSGLSELTSFLEYANVVDWHSRLAKGTSPKAGRGAPRQPEVP
jgi:hypothetical protein